MSNAKKFEIVFDKKSSNWEGDINCNRFFVRCTIQYLLDKLDYVGYLFVREILEKMGMPITKESITGGWYRPNEQPIFRITESKSGDSITITFSAEEDIRDHF